MVTAGADVYFEEIYDLFEKHEINKIIFEDYLDMENNNRLIITRDRSMVKFNKYFYDISIDDIRDKLVPGIRLIVSGTEACREDSIRLNMPKKLVDRVRDYTRG